MSRWRRTGRVLAVSGAALVLLGALALPAAAHGAAGTMGIEVTPGPAPLTARVRVLLEYANDGEVAPGATVSASATGPGGGAVGPVALVDRGQGSYETELTLPAAGDWSVTVTAADPSATASGAITVTASASSSGTLEGDLGAGSDAQGDDGIAISSDRVARDARRSDGEGGSDPALLVGIVVVLVAAAGTTFVLVRARRARTP